MLGVLYIVLLVCVWWGQRQILRLESVPPIPAEEAPRVSIVVPVRNEAQTIRATLDHLLDLRYPRYDIIVVDGQSTDGTERIIEEFTGERLRPVHIRQLPPRWIGKSYQLHVGAQEATGEWLLFMDAGVQLAPDALSRVMAYARAHQLDHLAVCPTLVMRGILERVFLAGFFLAFLLFTRPWNARNPRSKATIAVGPFTLVRTDAYRRAGGHEPISLQMADDLALGIHLKRHGCRQDFLYSDGSLRLRWYEGFAELLHGLEKNACWTIRCNPWLTVLAILALLMLAGLPYLGLFVDHLGWLKFHPLSPLVSVTSILLLYRRLQRITKIPWYYGLLYPVSVACWCLTLANSLWVTLRNGGVNWRGVFYPLRLLRSQPALSLRDLF